MIRNYLMQAAIASALAASAGSAFAYLPTSNADADKVIYWGGASASTQSAQDAIIDFVCDAGAGTINVMSRSSNWAIACRSTAAKTPALGNARVMVIKRDTGGSAVGVGPLQQGVALNFMAVSTGAGGACTGADAAKSSSNGTPYQERSCSTVDFAHVPDIGSSDIEPAMFTGLNAPVLNLSDGPGVPANNTPYPFDPNGPAFAKTATLGDLVFNTPVTAELYKALQAAQFAANSPCYPSAGNAAYNALVQVNVDDPATPSVNESLSAPRGDTEQCMPSLTREEISSIFTGQIKNWEEFKVLNTATNTTIDLRTAANNAGLVLPPLRGSATPVQVCRRTAGSGTQAQFSAEFLGLNCTAGVVPPKGASTLTLPFVAENSSASNVERCLDDFNSGTTNASGKNAGLVKRWAIGIRSTEASASPLATSPFQTFGYRYVKIDGYAPTIENVHRGDYWNFATQNLQASPTANADTLAVFDIIADNAFTIAGLKNLNNDCRHGFGRGCWLGSPKVAGASPEVFDVDLFAANPVNNFTRAPNGQPLNTCQPAIRTQFSTHVIAAPVPQMP